MNDVATISPPRLPVPPGIDPEQWRLITEMIFPMAKDPAVILHAINYCKHRKLDIMKRPVNIVPMWSSEHGKMIEQVWPSIVEIETTASRTGSWAGMDEPKWGPMITETFSGKRKDRKQGWIDVSIDVTYPEFCVVTVYRMVNGARCPFAEPVFWKEAYGRVGGSQLPNDMWAKRPKGQLLKVAKAFSLRAAFPEEGAGPTAEEMDGQVIEAPPTLPAPADNWTPPKQVTQQQPGELAAGDEDQLPPVEQTAQTTAQESGKTGQTEPAQQVTPHDPQTGEVGPREVDHPKDQPWREWCTNLLVFVRAETTQAGVDAWILKNKKLIGAIATDAPKVHTALQSAVGRKRQEILNLEQHGPET